MRLPHIITIDGPAASGKSTLGHLLAQRLGYTYFDTGVLYRALTALALRRGLPLDDPQALAALATHTTLAVVPPTVPDGRLYTLLVDGDDLTPELRTVAVDRNVSQVAAYPEVRTALREQQRRIGLQGNIVMVGRDIGVVVLPEAPFKVYLDASLGARGRRRHAELVEHGTVLSPATVETDLARRDARDARNTFKPADAWVLHTDELTLQQEIETLLQLIETGQWVPPRQIEL